LTDPAVQPVAAEAKPPGAQHRSRRLLRWLLVVLAVVLIAPLVFLGYRWQKQMAFLKRYDDVDTVLFLKSKVTTEPVGPDWLRNLVGEQRMRGFDDIVAVQAMHQASADDLQLLSRHPLRELHLFNTQLTAAGIEALGKMQDLRTVEFGAIETVSEPLLKALSRLKELETLRFTDTGQLSPGIILLDSTPPAMLDPIAISDRGPPIDPSLSPRSLRLLQQLPQLRFLAFHRMKITDDYLVEIAQLQHLEALDLCGTDVTDDGMAALAELPNLTYLNLSHTAVGDRGLARFHGHKRLQIFDLVDTNLTFDGMQHLKAGVPGCEVNLTFQSMPTPEYKP